MSSIDHTKNSKEGHMMQQIPEPTQKISPKAITVWRIGDAFSAFITLLILFSLLFAQHYFDWYNWIGMILYLLIGYVFLRSIYKLTIKPIYLQRTWRYEIDEDHIQMKHGFFHKYHLLVPMSRVEYVNTNQGPLLRKFGLSSVTIGTIASSHDIPAVSEKEAKVLREKIVHLAQIEKAQTVERVVEDEDENE